ncbi:MAG: hypothetical protein AAF662_04415, partial [Pseudomonadota bacterium]
IRLAEQLNDLLRCLTNLLRRQRILSGLRPDAILSHQLVLFQGGRPNAEIQAFPSPLKMSHAEPSNHGVGYCQSISTLGMPTPDHATSGLGNRMSLEKRERTARIKWLQKFGKLVAAALEAKHWMPRSSIE